MNSPGRPRDCVSAFLSWECQISLCLLLISNTALLSCIDLSPRISGSWSAVTIIPSGLFYQWDFEAILDCSPVGSWATQLVGLPHTGMRWCRAPLPGFLVGCSSSFAMASVLLVQRRWLFPCLVLLHRLMSRPLDRSGWLAFHREVPFERGSILAVVVHPRVTTGVSVREELTMQCRMSVLIPRLLRQIGIWLLSWEHHDS